MNPHSSTAQTKAQEIILKLVGKQLPANWEHGISKQIKLPDGTHVEVDGISLDPKILAEVYASPRNKGLLPGQKRKIATDILKLLTVREYNADWKDTRCILIFATDEARKSLTGWVRVAAKLHNIELKAVTDLPTELLTILQEAQENQSQSMTQPGPGFEE